VTGTEAFSELGRIGRRDPIALFHALWPDVELEPWQAETILEVWAGGYETEIRKVSVVCCNGAGKTFNLASLVVLFMIAFPPAIVVTTAGTFTQVRRQLWKEIAVKYNALPRRLQVGILNYTDWFLQENWYAIGISTNDAGYFEGFHGPHVLIVADESKSIDDPIFSAVDRIFAGRGRIKRCIQASSPGLPEGPHFDSFHDKAENWNRILVSPFEAWIEDELGRRDLPPTKTLSAEWIERMKREYGEDSAIYRSMVLAKWSRESAFRLFPLSSIDLMKRPRPEGAVRGELWLGADVARSENRDESFFQIIDRTKDPETGDPIYCFDDFLAFKTADSNVYEDNLVGFATEHGVAPEHINLDGSGIGGPVGDHLRRRGWRVNILDSATNAELETPALANLRSQMWWTGHDLARIGAIYGLTDIRTIGQLAAPWYRFNSRNEIQVATKEEIEKDLRKHSRRLAWSSPDRGDGSIYGLHTPLGSRISSYDENLFA